MRLFVALDLPATVKDDLARLPALLEDAIPDARWIPRQNLHVTLAFLGDVPDERVPSISEALSIGVAGLVDFPAHLSGVGAFPSWTRARVLWAGLADRSGGLALVADAVASSLEPLGFARGQRAFTAHATLARLRTPARVERPDVRLDPSPFPVERLTLFLSRLGRPNATYEALATFPFRREPAPPSPS